MNKNTFLVIGSLVVMTFAFSGCGQQSQTNEVVYEGASQENSQIQGEVKESEIDAASEEESMEEASEESQVEDSAVKDNIITENATVHVDSGTKKVKVHGGNDYIFSSIEEFYEFMRLKKNERGYYYTDNTEEVKSYGIPMAESLDEYYSYIEQAIRERKDSVDIFVNIYNLDVSELGLAHEIEDMDTDTPDGQMHQLEEIYVCDERPFADYERSYNKTGISAFWDPGYHQSLRFDLKYVYFEVQFTYVEDKLHFSYSNEEMCKKINKAIEDGETRFTICRYYKSETPDVVASDPTCRNYLFCLSQNEIEEYYRGYHILNITYDNPEMIALTNDGPYSGAVLWNGISFDYCEPNYEGYQDFECFYYITLDIRNVKNDLEVREGLTQITSMEQLVQERERYDYSTGHYWLGYFRGTQEEAYDMHVKMSDNRTPVAYARIADGWWYFYWG